jgi:hypothetical protein
VGSGYSERRGGCEEGTDNEGRRIRTEEIRSTSRESVDGISVSLGDEELTGIERRK